jgi:multicomponent Na+:H+ antiporter subunit B
VLYAIAHGADATRAALRYEPQNIAMIGLGIALAAGSTRCSSATRSSPANGGSSATGKRGLHPDLSVLVFDIGVYLVVFGSILTLVLALEEEV